MRRTEDLAGRRPRWLAYTSATSPRHTAIKLFELATGQRVLATQPEFATTPRPFDPDGPYLYFLSLRTFDPIYDSVQFGLSLPRAARPYLIALQRAARRHRPGTEGLAEPGRQVGASEGSGAVKVDCTGIASRIAPFPVPENLSGKVSGATGNKVVLEHPADRWRARTRRPQGREGKARGLRP